MADNSSLSFQRLVLATIHSHHLYRRSPTLGVDIQHSYISAEAWVSIGLINLIVADLTLPFLSYFFRLWEKQQSEHITLWFLQG